MLNYKIYADKSLIYSPHDNSLKVYDPKLELTQNGISTFEFSLPKNNYDKLKLFRMASVIDLWRNDELLFSGPMIDDDQTIDNEVTVKCKNEYYYLNQTLQRPATYGSRTNDDGIIINENGDEVQTTVENVTTVPVVGIFKKYINNHNNEVLTNGRKFTIGTVNVSGNAIVENTDYKTTWECISSLIDDFGGYLNLRYDGGTRYIDWVSDFADIASQKAELRLNVTDVSIEESGQDIATVLIPTGATVEETKVVTDENGDEVEKNVSTVTTIASVNNNQDYIQDEEGVNKYGRIMVHKQYEGITDPQTLLSTAQNDLKNLVKPSRNIIIKIVDLASVDNQISAIGLGKYIIVNDTIFGLSDKYIPVNISLELFDVENNEIELSIAEQSEQNVTYTNTQSNKITDEVSDLNNQYVDISSTLDSATNEINDLTSTVDDLSSRIQELINVTADYTIEFGEIIGNGSFYFTRNYTDRPYYQFRTSDGSVPTITLSTSGDSKNPIYVGATLSGVDANTATLVVFYCTLPEVV